MTLTSTVLLHTLWLVAVPQDTEKSFTPLFNGESLANWEGDMKLWKVADKAIVGDSKGIKHNQFICTKKEYDDFELRLEFRLENGVGNSGIQFRSKRIKNSTEVSGYQADIGERYWGCLYDESRRRRVLVQAPEKALSKVLKKDGWNKYVIKARGSHITLSINGVITADYKEQDESIARKGIIGLQVHSGPPLTVRFRNIRIREFDN